jgi:cobaltochelatase CobN
MQIRDGLHIFGRVPADASATISSSRSRGFALGFGAGCLVAPGAGARSRPWRIDPLTRDLAADFEGRVLRSCNGEQHRMAYAGDTVERIEWLVLQLVAGAERCDSA